MNIIVRTILVIASKLSQQLNKSAHSSCSQLLHNFSNSKSCIFVNKLVHIFSKSKFKIDYLLISVRSFDSCLINIFLSISLSLPFSRSAIIFLSANLFSPSVILHIVS